jgi:hypothetical protein
MKLPGRSHAAATTLLAFGWLQVERFFLSLSLSLFPSFFLSFFPILGQWVRRGSKDKIAMQCISCQTITRFPAGETFDAWIKSCRKHSFVGHLDVSTDYRSEDG